MGRQLLGSLVFMTRMSHAAFELQVKRGAHPPQRPRVPLSACPIAQLLEIMETCWEESPDIRFSFARVRELLQKALGSKGDNIIEHLINQMDRYAAELEHEGQT
jgi:hypothetical protein